MPNLVFFIASNFVERYHRQPVWRQERPRVSKLDIVAKLQSRPCNLRCRSSSKALLTLARTIQGYRKSALNRQNPERHNVESILVLWWWYSDRWNGAKPSTFWVSPSPTLLLTSLYLIMQYPAADTGRFGNNFRQRAQTAKSGYLALIPAVSACSSDGG